MTKRYLVKDFFENHAKALDLQTVLGGEWLTRGITIPEIQRPGVSLSGYVKNYVSKRILVFGKIEIQYLQDLGKGYRLKRLRTVLTKETPCVILSRGQEPLQEMMQICEKNKIPLFSTSLKTMDFLNKATFLLAEDFAPMTVCHGTLVEVFGMGVLIQGESSVGKSEAALGLLDRRHRLVADDVVQVKVKEGRYLEGTGPQLTRHLMEIRGIGIINMAHLYGSVCVCEYKRLDLVVKLEEWDDGHFYDRTGLEERVCDILGIQLPYYILPLKPGRDVVLLIETIVMNDRLKAMGYNSAKEFREKLAEAIARKQEEVKEVREKSHTKG